MNWGTKLVIGLATFMLFILGMGFYMISASQKDGLIADDYYEQGIAYDAQTEAENRVFDQHAEPKIKLESGRLLITMPNKASYELKLMRKSAAQDDITQKGDTLGDSHLILIDASNLASGSWILDLKWQYQAQDYHYKKEIQL